MSLQNVSTVGNTVYVSVVLTKAAGQVGTPVAVSATVKLSHEGTLISPDPTASVSVNAGVATVTFNHAVNRDNTLSGDWAFGIATTGDLVAAYDGSFHLTRATVLDAS
jgi:hypothetical protein